jgi:hypothetical protein
MTHMSAELKFDVARPVAIPRQSEAAVYIRFPDFMDAFAIRLPADATRSAEILARFIFSRHLPWVERLMRIRDAVAGRCGLKTASNLVEETIEENAARIGLFSIYSTSETEIVLGADDRHLDFRVSVLWADDPVAAPMPRLIVTTTVKCHNRLGRAYIFIVAPFHRLVVKAYLRRSAATGWPRSVHGRSSHVRCSHAPLEEDSSHASPL